MHAGGHGQQVRSPPATAGGRPRGQKGTRVGRLSDLEDEAGEQRQQHPGGHQATARDLYGSQTTMLASISSVGSRHDARFPGDRAAYAAGLAATPASEDKAPAAPPAYGDAPRHPHLLQAGDRVLARWPADGFYYPAMLAQPGVTGGWHVSFGEGEAAEVGPDEVFWRDGGADLRRGNYVLAPGGVEGSDMAHVAGTVVGCDLAPPAAVFVVRLQNGLEAGYARAQLVKITRGQHDAICARVQAETEANLVGMMQAIGSARDNARHADDPLAAVGGADGYTSDITAERIEEHLLHRQWHNGGERGSPGSPFPGQLLHPAHGGTLTPSLPPGMAGHAQGHAVAEGAGDSASDCTPPSRGRDVGLNGTGTGVIDMFASRGAGTGRHHGGGGSLSDLASVVSTVDVGPNAAPQRTVALVLPDGLRAGMDDAILREAVRAGLRIVIARDVHLSIKRAREFYWEFRDRPDYEALAECLSDGPCRVAVLAGPGALTVWSSMIGQVRRVSCAARRRLMTVMRLARLA